MTRVFISSLVRGDMAELRGNARRAVESLQMTPVMLETAPPAAEASRRALLDLVAGCDAVVLLLGAQHGEPGGRGTSPTEEEFREAVHHGIPVLALVQEDVDRGSAQAEFVTRVRGSWEEGSLTGRFTDASDIGFAVVQALNSWRGSGPAESQVADARARALELASSRDRGGGSSGSRARLIVVPVGAGTLINAVTLGQPTLADDLASALRLSGVVDNRYGISTSLDERHVVLQAEASREFDASRAVVGPDGAIAVQAPVGGDGMLGSSVVDGPRLQAFLGQASDFVSRVWQRVDERDVVRQVVATVAIPEAQYKAFSSESFSANSVQMGSHSLPEVLVAPVEPVVLRRADLGATTTVAQLVAEVRQSFADAGSLV